MRKNIASQNVAAQMNSQTDGTPLTASVSVFVTIDNGTQTAGAGTLAHKGNGHWNYAPTQAETNGNHLAFTFAHGTGVNQTVNVYTVSYDPHDTVRLGITALPNAAAEAAGGLYTRGTGAGQVNQAANGMIDTNPVRLNNVSQSLLDLKDFADDGYDPATNKVQGVVLVDTLTTYTGNTPQTGDSFARIGAAGASLTDLGGMSTTMRGQVQTEAEDALVVHRLDELVNADSDIDGAAPPTVGSVFHELMSKTAGSFTFDQATDSCEAIRDRGDAAWVTATGFSTHSAADVWAVAARTLTSLAGLTVDTVTTLTNLPPIPVNWLTAAGIATAALNGKGDWNVGKTGFSLLATGLDLVLVDGKTLPAALQYIAASTAGKVSGAGTGTETFLGVDGATTRLTITVDASGNRSAITYG